MTKRDLNRIMKVVNSHWKVADRKKELEKMGYKVEWLPMGSGGVGSIRYVNKQTRIQIGYGQGRYNYAFAVCIPDKKKK